MTAAEGTTDRGRRRRLLAILAVSGVLVAGVALGPTPPERDPFAMPGDATYRAQQRVLRELPTPEVALFLFVAGRDATRRGNVLELEVLRALAARGDQLRADPVVGPLLARVPGPGGEPTRGPWGLPEAIRAILDGEDPSLPWPGPSFAEAGPSDLARLLDGLLEFEVPGLTGDVSRPFRLPLAPDLERSDSGQWTCSGLLHPIRADRARLDAAIAAGTLADVEDFELRVDAIYQPALGAEVRCWSYAGFDAQIEQQIEASLPLVLAAFLLMPCLIGVLLGDLRDACATLVSLLLLVGWIVGARCWLGFPNTQLAATLPILMLALGVDFYMHTATRWRALLAAGFEPLEAAPRATRGLRRALGLATVTTSVAFGTAALNRIPTLAEWGWLSIVAIPAAYVLLGVFAPLLRAGWRPPRPRPGGEVAWASALARTSARLGQRHRWALIALFGLLTAGAVSLGSPRAGFDAGDYFARDSRLLQTIRMDKLTFPHMGAPGTILVEGGDLADEAALLALQELVAGLPAIGAAQSAAAYEPTLLDVLRICRAAGDGAGGLSAGDLLVGAAALGVRGPPGTGVELSPARLGAVYRVEGGAVTATRIPFAVSDPDDWPALGALRGELDPLLAPLRALPDVRVTVTGPSYVRYAFVNGLTEGFRLSTLGSIVACAVVLLLALRGLVLTAVTLAPALCAAFLLQGGMVLAGQELNVISVQVLSLSVGLGLDYSIHLVQRFREARAVDRAAGSASAIELACRETVAALLGSALTTAAGFSLLMLAPMSLLVGFGALMVVAIVTAACAAVALVPALLSVTHRG